MKAMKTRLTVASSMLEGIAIGALAVRGLNAQAKPPAYVIAEIAPTAVVIGFSPALPATA
jgi:hypothetical protein